MKLFCLTLGKDSFLMPHSSIRPTIRRNNKIRQLKCIVDLDHKPKSQF